MATFNKNFFELFYRIGNVYSRNFCAWNHALSHAYRLKLQGVVKDFSIEFNLGFLNIVSGVLLDIIAQVRKTKHLPIFRVGLS